MTPPLKNVLKCIKSTYSIIQALFHVLLGLEDLTYIWSIWETTEVWSQKFSKHFRAGEGEFWRRLEQWTGPAQRVLWHILVDHILP